MTEWTDRLKTFAAWAAGTIGIGTIALAFGWVFVTFIAYKPPSAISIPAAPAPEVARAPTVTVTPKAGVKVYAGDTKAHLKLPSEVVQNQAEHVVAATQVRSSDRPQTITTTISAETGESRSFVKTDPYPWFALETRGEARLAYGYKFNGSALPAPVVRLGVGYDVVRIKALTAGLTASIDSDGTAFAGIGIAYRW